MDALYRQESGRIRASLIRLLGSFELAEEALQDAFLAAAQTWPRQGIPASPRAWLVSAGRFRAIDRIRASTRASRNEAEAEYLRSPDSPTLMDAEELVADDTLRLIFMCCHPDLPQAARIALTLREVCGLRTEEIADAFLLPPATIAQRVVRAKTRIREHRLSFDLPGKAELAERLSTVHAVIYLVFNEGYSSSAGNRILRADLAQEGIRLARLLIGQQAEQETIGLLALMLLHHSRQAARTDSQGNLVVLPQQDRTLWDRALIAEGRDLIDRALSIGEPGPYTLQAQISAEHCRAEVASDTRWARIVAYYDKLLDIWPTPVVALNRAVALGEAFGAEVGLQGIEQLMSGKALDEYHLAHAARAEFLRRLDRFDEARQVYALALRHVRQEPERRFLELRIREVEKASSRA